MKGATKKELIQVILKQSSKLEIAIEALEKAKSKRAQIALHEMWEVDENGKYLDKERDQYKQAYLKLKEACEGVIENGYSGGDIRLARQALDEVKTIVGEE